MTGPGWSGPPPRDVCIVMLSAIGDAVHVLPVANALRRAWPETRITWIIQRTAWQLVRHHPAIDDFIIFDRYRGPRAWEGFRRIMETLRGRRFDLLLGLQVYFKAGLITALAPARVKLGFDRLRARDGQWLFTNQRIAARGQRHVQDQYFEFLEHLGIAAEPLEWRLDLTDDERRAQDDFMTQVGRPVCGMVVGTSKDEKDWAAPGYARVAAHVHSRGLQPVIVGGPSHKERRIADQVAAEARVPVTIALGDDLRRLLWLVEGSALVVAPDTGPLHIARAVDTPVVGLYGYTNPKRSGPYRSYSDLVVDGYADHPGENYPISPAYRDGMRRVRVEDVLAKIDVALERYVEPRARRAGP